MRNKKSNSAEQTINSLLKARHRIHRKITIYQKWSWKTSLKNRIKLLFLLKDPLFLIWNDFQSYKKLGLLIKKAAVENELLETTLPIEINSVFTDSNYPFWFRALQIFDEQLRQHNSFLILQGSFADTQTTNYSDVDLVLFYSDFNQSVKKIKKKIEQYILKIDPLQHHGVFAIDQNNFSYYWQMDLPVQVLSKAKCFSENTIKLKISAIIKENISSKQALNANLLGIEQFLKTDYTKIGLWQWKFFLSNLMLCPTLLLGAKGQYVYKRDSFAIVRPMLSDKAWYVIQKASEIRNNWPDKIKLKKYLSIRKTSTLPPSDDFLKAKDLDAISIINDKKFTNSLNAFQVEVRKLVNG